MTDADVDGAHIRTLILTFLYRQSKALIEAGYVYIAAPPLYLIKYGNQERYIEKESELEEFLVNERIEQITSKSVDGTETAWTHAKWQRLTRDLKEAAGWSSTLASEYGKSTADWLRTSELLVAELNSFDDLVTWVKQVRGADALADLDIASIDEQAQKITLRSMDRATAAATMVHLSWELFNSSAFKGMRRVTDKLVSVAGRPSFTVCYEKKEETVTSWEALRSAMLELMRDGIKVQRFKGLGEMNPEQLWETTMDPEKRILHRVTIEQAESADETFSTLMGDAVEPRRLFIERHARKANLDI
jgi:DNA gyrase subunit B